MALYVVPNNKTIDGAVQAPAATTYAMYFDAGAQVAFADSYSELMMALAPGYLLLPEATQAELRKSLAHTLAPLIQSNALNPDDPESLQASILDLHAQVLNGEAKPEDITHWEESAVPAPLVVLCHALHKKDHPDSPHYWHVCAASERLLVRSLHRYGIVKLMKRDS